MAAAARELTEETGLQARLAIHLFDHESRSLLHSVFLVTVHEGDYSPRDDVQELFELPLEGAEGCTGAYELSWSTAAILRRFSAWRMDHTAFFDSVVTSIS
jgi:8-oxo-dGTP pyrophosphatase MutT (NUDIX family)